MLAAHFLNVVLEENEAGIPENENEPEDEESNNNNTIYDVISQLDIKSQLAKILLSECTIEPSKTAQKREKPVLRFEANVTPIYNVPPKKPKPNDELSLLTAVEAVYSDGEENEGSDESSPMVPCPVCNRSFSRNCSLALHMKSHEPLDEHFRRYQCNFCPRSFPQKSVLKKHIMECAVQRGFSPTSFAQEQQDGSMNPPRRYECQFCHRSYTQKSVLKKHLVVHTGERERCNICGAGFSQRSSLVRHAKRIHGGMLNHAIGAGAGGPSSVSPHSGIPSGNGISPTISQVITTVGGIHNTPILTTALSGVTHPTFGTPLIVGIPLNQLAAGKFAGTQFAATAGSILGRHPGLTALNTQTPPKAHGSGFPNIVAGGTSKAVPAAIPINLARLTRTSPLNNMKNPVNNTSTSSAPAMSSQSTSDPILTASLNRNINPAPISDVTKAIFESAEEKSDPPDAVLGRPYAQ